MAKLIAPEDLAPLVGELGYRAQITGARTIRTAMSGYQVLILGFTGSLQFYFGVDVREGLISLEDINKFNSDYRFAKCYVNEGSVNLEMDSMFDIEAGSAKDDLEALFSTFETSMAAIDRALLEPAFAKDIAKED
jgi:hypothetical protein